MMNNKQKAPSSILSFAFFPLFFLLCFPSSVSAFNITKLLNEFPEFGAFNDYLTKTHLFEQINTRNTITILALDNSTVSAIAKNSLDTVKEILGAHIILDYYDPAKLRKLPVGKPTEITSMFQSTGDAVKQQGFLKIVHNKRGEIEFGSAAKGAPFSAMLVKSVASRPYDISVLQVSAPIVIPGIGVYNLPPPAPETLFVAPVEAPSPSPADDDVDDADSPSPSSKALAESPRSSSPKSAEVADDADAPGPADSDADGSAASRGRVAGGGVVLAGLVALCLAW